MSSKIIKVTIKGITPLLMHSFPMEPVEAIEKKTPDEQAELAAYRLPPNGKFKRGELYAPGVNMQRCLIAAAAFSKGKGRASLQKNTAACVMISPENLGFALEDYERDTRPVVVPATKGRVLRHRPRLPQWELNFTIEYDDTLLKATEVRKIVDDAGSRVGFLDFRPEKKGPYGRFSVTHWDDGGASQKEKKGPSEPLPDEEDESDEKEGE